MPQQQRMPLADACFDEIRRWLTRVDMTLTPDAEARIRGRLASSADQYRDSVSTPEGAEKAIEASRKLAERLIDLARTDDHREVDDYIAERALRLTGIPFICTFPDW